MRWLFYRPHIANIVYTYVEKFMDCRKRRRRPTHQRLQQLFFPEEAPGARQNGHTWTTSQKERRPWARHCRILTIFKIDTGEFD